MIGSLCKDSIGYFVVLSFAEQTGQYFVCSRQCKFVKTISECDDWHAEHSEICDINGK